MALAEPVVTELTIDARGAERGQAQYVRAMSNAQAAQERMIATNTKLFASQSQHERIVAQVAAANDNLARSYNAVNDNVRDASKSFVDVGAEVVKTAGHLKFLAAAAYAMSPAFRAMVNPAVVGALQAMGPAAVAAGSAIVSAMTPALAFISRIAVPVLAIVAAWRLLNQVIDRGSGLLEKYGNSQRDLVAGVDDNLKKLTRFQDAGLSADQVQRATELGARLNEATRTISEFSRVQLDVTNIALRLQAVWVGIVEVIAAAVQQLNAFMNRIPSIPGGFDTILKVVSNIPVIGLPAAGLRAAAPSSASPVDMEAAMQAARQRLAAGMGSTSNFANRFGNAVNDLQNIPKEAEKATKAIQETAKAWDQYDNAVQRVKDQIDVMEEQVKWLGKTTEEVDKLRIVRDLERAAHRAGIELSAEDIAANEALATKYATLREELRRVNEQRQMVESLGSAIVSSFTSGGNAIESFTRSLAGLGQQLASKNLSRLLNGGSLFGNQQLGSVAGLAGMIGAGAMGYQSGSPLMGVAGGALAGASFGPAGMAAGAVIGGIGGLFGQRANKAKADAEKYQQAIQSVLDANEKMAQAQQRQAEEAARAAEEAAAKIEAAANRRRGYEDIIFGSTTDTSTLEGQLLELARERERAIEDEAKAGNENALLVQEAFEVKRLSVIKAANDNILAETKRAEEDRRRALDQGARSVVDYLAGLNAGDSSPFSPSQRLSAARDIFNVTDTLARQNDASALARWTQDAEALRVAARAMFASGSGYQDIFSDIQSRGLTLPAVQQSEDPIVNAIASVLIEIQKGNLAQATDATLEQGILAQATDATLTGTIKAAIDSGNAANVASELSTYFSALDTSVNGVIDSDEFVAGLRGMASDSALRDMFTRLDTDHSGGLDRLELIKQSSEATEQSSSATRVNTSDTAVYTARTDDSLSAANVLLDASRNILAASQPHFQNLQDIYTSSNATASTLSGVLTDKIKDIEKGTYATARNTRYQMVTGANPASAGPNPNSILAYAEGGWVRGPGSGTDDRINAMLSNGEYVVRAVAAQQLAPFMETINRGRLPAVIASSPSNDNREVVAELKALRRELAMAQGQIARLIAAADEHNVGAIVETNKKTTEAIAMNQRNPRAA